MWAEVATADMDSVLCYLTNQQTEQAIFIPLPCVLDKSLKLKQHEKAEHTQVYALGWGEHNTGHLTRKQTATRHGTTVHFLQELRHLSWTP